LIWIQATEAETVRLGLDLASLNEKSRQRLRVPSGVRGVVVAGVHARSMAAALGLRPGDIIETINVEPVMSPEDAGRKLKRAAGGDMILLLISRDSVSQFVGVTVGPANVGGSGASPKAE
jgi:serine protease Do